MTHSTVKVKQRVADSTIKSRERVADHGEVLTPQPIVNAMLDLVRIETERIDSRFLEPACGTGNFLIEILQRKLNTVAKRYRRSQLEYERYAVLAVSSLYGIELLNDNVEECRERLFTLFDEEYSALYRKKTKEKCRDTVRYILDRNIVQGDALTLHTVGKHPEHIVFSEWTLVNRSRIKRREFVFRELIPRETDHNPPDFFNTQLVSDQGTPVFIPQPIREYPPVHFLEVAYAYNE